jgi:integrase
MANEVRMNARSTMQHKVEAYLAERRRAGYALRIEGQQLARFARFTDTTGYRGPLTIDIASRWAIASRRGRRITAARRIEVLRPFARYCRSWDCQSEIPPLRMFGPGHRRLTPHIYKDSEIRTLMRAALELQPPEGLRGETCSAIIGLMASCGLRISEALALRRGKDVDLEQGLLHIRQGKFGKARLVPMHSTTRSALRRYAQRRDRDPQCKSVDAFFVFDHGREVTTANLHYAFRTVRGVLSHRPRGGHSQFRLHDLRHTFVCRRLERWYQRGIDIDRRMLSLSTYIGHAHPTDTYWYATATPRLMALAARRLDPLAAGGAT